MKNTLKYNDFLVERYYKDVDMILESNGSIKKKLIQLLKKVLRVGFKYRRKVFIYGLIALVTLTSASKLINLIESDKEINNLYTTAGFTEDMIADFESKMDTMSTADKAKALKASGEDKEIKLIPRKWTMMKSPNELKLSQRGWDYIRNEEGSRKRKGEPVLKAYAIGDGMITIGWGHAEKSKKSQFKVGDTITYDQAYSLLQKDLTKAANGVRRIFNEWEDKGIDIQITQDQFDVLVSLAFNSGVGALRKSPIIKYLKKGDHEKAGEAMSKWRVSKKFPGLKKRRSKEYQWWMSYKTFS